ncbi:MAG: acetate--CoA ligase family protein [Thermoprotei archaeon]
MEYPLASKISKTRIKTLKDFFEPKTVAIIGASHKPNSVGNVLVRNFLYGRFMGRVYLVNPNYKEILGKPCYPTVKEIPEKIDLAIVAVRAEIVPQIIEQCGEAGIKNVLVLSSGFRETGPDGAKLEQYMLSIAKKWDIRIIGPNCLGIYNAENGLDALFLPDTRLRRAKAGGVAFISQSGALLAAIMDLAAAIDIGFSKAVSYGNRADVDEATLIEYLLYDEKTKIIAAYIEGLEPGKGKQFLESIRRVIYHKPVIIVKGGKSISGSRAAASHTGSLAGEYNLFRSALRQVGAIEATNFEDMFDFIKALTMQPLLSGNKLLVLTNGGGLGVMMTDAAEEYGFNVPELSKETQSKLKSILRPFAAIKNPVDVTANGTAEMYREVLEIVFNSNEVDAAIIGILPQTPDLGIEIVDNLIVAKSLGKPMVVVTVGGELTTQISKMLETGGIPVYPSPERGVRALKVLRDYYEIKERFKCETSNLECGTDG